MYLNLFLIDEIGNPRVKGNAIFNIYNYDNLHLAFASLKNICIIGLFATMMFLIGLPKLPQWLDFNNLSTVLIQPTCLKVPAVKNTSFFLICKKNNFFYVNAHLLDLRGKLSQHDLYYAFNLKNLLHDQSNFFS